MRFAASPGKLTPLVYIYLYLFTMFGFLNWLWHRSISFYTKFNALIHYDQDTHYNGSCINVSWIALNKYWRGNDEKNTIFVSIFSVNFSH